MYVHWHPNQVVQNWFPLSWVFCRLMQVTQLSNHESSSWSQKFVRCPNNRLRFRTALLAVHGSRVSDYTRDASWQMKWNESGFRPPLCTYRLNWARRTSWGWWDDWDDTVLQTQDSKFEPWRSEAENATSRSRRLPTILTFTRASWQKSNTKNTSGLLFGGVSTGYYG